MVNLALLSSFAQNAIVGAVATKIVDTLISTKVNTKMEHNKWIRKTKLDIYSDLTEAVISLDKNNFDEKSQLIKKNISKIVLLLNNRNITKSLENYLNILKEFENDLISKQSLDKSNILFINYLKKNLKV